MAYKDIKNIEIEGAKITFRNFAGEPTDVNPAGGDRDFAVIISDEAFAQELINEGWNVKAFKNPNANGEQEYYLKVKVSYKYANRAPKIWLCSDYSDDILLSEETVKDLDAIDIRDVDITISPYNYTVRGESGISAYVKSMYVNVVEDAFAAKHRKRKLQRESMDEMPWT